ncbi:SURF1 family cytochrome oxidase biogenesis protein [Canibacter oris]|uniref:SURF1-like protein n=1 Tax=Canibacter oris TaxID=1365628 RepID=A0A840DEI8_9MICO|nr:cytochrome oxidase assembly protein ShyY1 [Canibacter oris]
MSKEYPGWRFLYSPRWMGYYAMLAVFAVACVLLSNWQFDRREQAKAEIARIVNNYDQAPQPLTTVLPDPNSFDADSQKWLPFEATGEYLGTPALVRNRPGSGGTGSHLVQAFKTTSGLIIFVDRGWVAEAVDEKGRADFAALPLAPTGTQVTLTGRLRGSEAVISGSRSTVHSTGSINTAELTTVTGLAPDAEVATAVYAMLTAENPYFDSGEISPKPLLDEGPHLSYALQWIVFIAIAGTGIGYAARQEFKHFNRGSKKVAHMEQQARIREAKRRARRGASDAEEEDALLDAA